MKNIYFLSDAHLGSRAIEHNRTHERRLVNFLDSIKHKAEAVYLLGDMFDFWYEFKLVVPKGYTRFLGKISNLPHVSKLGRPRLLTRQRLNVCRLENFLMKVRHSLSVIL